MINTAQAVTAYGYDLVFWFRWLFPPLILRVMEPPAIESTKLLVSSKNRVKQPLTVADIALSGS